MQIIFSRTHIFSSGWHTMCVWHIHWLFHYTCWNWIKERGIHISGGKSITDTQHFFLHMHLRFLAAASLNTYMPLRVRGCGDPGSFSSVLAVRVIISLRWSVRVLWVNHWLHAWHWQEGCGFYNHMILLKDWRFLAADGVHSIKWSKRISTNRQKFMGPDGMHPQFQRTHPDTSKPTLYSLERSLGVPKDSKKASVTPIFKTEGESSEQQDSLSLIQVGTSSPRNKLNIRKKSSIATKVATNAAGCTRNIASRFRNVILHSCSHLGC